MKALAFALRALKRDFRAGELYVLLVALVIAAASVTSVSFFIDRAKQGLERQATELLGADLVIVSSQPLASYLVDEAQRRGLATAETASFLSMVLSGTQSQLAEVKAVSERYPLRGHLRVAARPYDEGMATTEIPARRTVWLDSRLMSLLAPTPGQSLQLGATSLRVAQVVSYEPDRGGELFNIAPRVLMNLADLPATRLIQPGSRVRYRLLLAGEPGALAAFRQWAQPRLAAGMRWQDIRDARPELRSALTRAEQFLGLAAVTSVVLAGLAVALAARRYSLRHLDTAALLRCLGASQRFVLILFIAQMLVLGVIASVVGGALGYLGQSALIALLQPFLPGALPSPSPLPLAQGLLIDVVTLLGFALPPLARLRAVPPLRVLRRDLGPLPASAIAIYGSGLFALAALILWQARDLRLAVYVLLGTVATLLILAVGARLLVRALAVLRARVGVSWRFGLANIARRAGASIAQTVAFGAGIMILLLLSLVRADLLADWQDSLPPMAPNRFAINIQPDQLAPIRDFFLQHGINAPTFYPMVRARLVAINGKKIAPADYADERARRLVEREFNLSWATKPQADNRLVAGRWWAPNEEGAAVLSVEQGLAETLRLKLDDVLTYRIAGEDVRARIVNLRHVQWDSFRVNFFVLTPPGLLDGFPASYVTSFYLSPTQADLLTDFAHAFPNITLIDVQAIMSRVREVMDRVTAAMQYVFVFTVIAGLVVLFAAIQTTLDERVREAAILRALGASRAALRLALISEFVTLGLLAGVLAAGSANIVAYVLARHLFHLPFHSDPWLWIAGMLGGALSIGLFGGLAAAPVIRRPPWPTLQRN